MRTERNPENSLERGLWRGLGVGIAIESVKLIATLPFPKTEARALEMMGIGLLIPLWAIWGEAKGHWIEQDFSRLTNFLTKKVKGHISENLLKSMPEIDIPGKGPVQVEIVADENSRPPVIRRFTGADELTDIGISYAELDKILKSASQPTTPQ